MPKTKTKRPGGGRSNQYAGPKEGKRWKTRTMTSSTGKKKTLMVDAESNPRETRQAMKESLGERADTRKSTRRKPTGAKKKRTAKDTIAGGGR